MVISSVLVTGGAGYIGSHCVLKLLEAGKHVFVVDNLANSYREQGAALPTSLQRVQELTGKTVQFEKVDICDYEPLIRVFKQNSFDCVLHLAGLKAVGESIAMPLVYYEKNLGGCLNLLQCMREAGVRRMIFSSSATVYGTPSELPLTEASTVGIGLTNPYGQTKYMQEQILTDLARADKDWSVVLLRYFNPVGGHPSGRIGEDPAGVPNNLMPYVAQVAVGRLPHVRVYGNDYDTVDGTGVRDYIHVMDLAAGHTAAVQLMDSTPDPLGCKVYNLGTGTGYSVLQMIAALEKASGKKIAYKMEGRRPGDLASVYCDPALAASQLGWKAQFGLDEMCRDMWNWQNSNPNGYKQAHS